jgi:hypothetical protein
MTWKIVFRPEVEQDVSEAAAWYESREPGLGRRFTSEIIDVWDSLPEIHIKTRAVTLPKTYAGAIPNTSLIEWSTRF